MARANHNTRVSWILRKTIPCGQVKAQVVKGKVRFVANVSVTYSLSLFEALLSHLPKALSARGALLAHAVNELVDFELHRDWALEKFGDKSGDW